MARLFLIEQNICRSFHLGYTMQPAAVFDLIIAPLCFLFCIQLSLHIRLFFLQGPKKHRLCQEFVLPFLNFRQNWLKFPSLWDRWSECQSHFHYKRKIKVAQAPNRWMAITTKWNTLRVSFCWEKTQRKTLGVRLGLSNHRAPYKHRIWSQVRTDG